MVTPVEMCNVPERNLSHEEMLEVTRSSLATLLRLDQLLSDIPPDVMLEEVLAQAELTWLGELTSTSRRHLRKLSKIAVEHGQSITILLDRDTEPTLKIVVPQNVTVVKLKKAIARHFEIYQQRINNKKKISWKYIWRTYNLSYDGVILDDDNSNIGDYGVGNKTTLTFKKRFKKKPK